MLTVWLLRDRWYSRWRRLTTIRPWPWTVKHQWSQRSNCEITAVAGVCRLLRQKLEKQKMPAKKRRTPRPPSFIGKLAWSHWISVRERLQLLLLLLLLLLYILYSTMMQYIKGSRILLVLFGGFDRYRSFRDAEGNKTEFYWQLLCIRLLFVILFEVRLSLR